MISKEHFMFLCYGIILLILGVVCLPETPVDQCPGRNSSRPMEVNVINCTEQPCKFKRRTNVIMYMTFKATEHIDSLGASVIATVEGADVPFPLPQPNACKALTNTHCPLEINEIGVYRLQMPILFLYPKITLKLALILKANGKSEDLTCFSIAAQIV